MQKKKNNIIFCIVKYFIIMLIIIYCSISYHSILYLVYGVSEILLIMSITNVIIRKNKKIGYSFNAIMILLFLLNVLLLIHSNTFINLIMLLELMSIKALGGKILIYLLSLLLVCAISFAPVCEIKLLRNKYIILFIIIEIVLLCFFNKNYSSLYSYKELIIDSFNYIERKIYIKKMHLEENDFLNDSIKNEIDYNNFTKKYPNIILIFAEGLSHHIIYDDRNIMPNLKEYMNNSISFNNYYNHTVYTYRGLIGQLYSGYQAEDYNSNKLVSIQSILKGKNYNTAFINVEPDNKTFSDFLNNFGFDTVISEKDKNAHLYDNEAYSLLYESAINLSKDNKPFFLSIYTFGTHVSWDSNDQVFGDKSSNVLNRFYNMDYHFGLFMDKFKNSELYDNTIIVFTSDHASYNDYDYKSAFKNISRVSNIIDSIPLMIYHKNVIEQNIDVHGRNSLDLVPTILDYIDVDEPNYFLGTSLFANDTTDFDTTFFIPYLTFSTSDGEIKEKNDKETLDKITNYISVSTN